MEDRFVFPMMSRPNIRRYGLNGVTYILLPHENRKGVHNAVPESTMKVDYTDTYAWLLKWRKILEDTKARNSKFYRKGIDPFYERDNVGPYTFAPFKVAWIEQNTQMIACVVSTAPAGPLAGKLVIPELQSLYFAPIETEIEAHYLCAIWNSRTGDGPDRGLHPVASTGDRCSRLRPHSKVRLNDPVHRELSTQSKRAHAAVGKGSKYGGRAEGNRPIGELLVFTQGPSLAVI